MRPKPLLLYLVIAAAVLAVYGRCFFASLGVLDDRVLITGNPLVTSPSVSALAGAWQVHPNVLYVPLVTNIWTLLSWLGGGEAPNAVIFHGANVLLHAATAMLAFVILRLILANDWCAALGAILWAVHPIQVEPVAWASGMKDVASGFLAMAALCIYLLSAKRDAQANGKRSWTLYSAAGLLMLLAGFAKPGAAAVPLFAVIVDILILGRGRRALLCALPMLLAVLPAVLIARWTQSVGDAPFITPPLTRPLIAGHAIFTYLLHIIWPTNLTFDYGLTPRAVLQNPSAYVAWIWPVGITIALITVRRTSRPLLAGWLIFLAGVLPVSGLVPFGYQFWSTVADRYSYLAMLGIAICIGWSLTKVPARLAVTAGAILCLACGLRAYWQAGAWKDPFTLGGSAIVANPRSSLAYSQLGVAYFDGAGAIARTIDPQTDESGRRSAWSRVKEMDQKASAAFERAVELRPDNADALTNLARTYRRLGQEDLALQTLERAMDAMELTPLTYRYDSEDRLKAGEVFLKRGEYGRAAGHVRKYLQTHPDSAKATRLLERINAAAATQPTTRPG